MFEIIVDSVLNIIKHGWSWAAAVGIIGTFYRHRKALQKLLHLGKEQETQLDRIEHKLDALMSAGGITWDAASVNGKIAHRLMIGQQKKLLLQRVASAPVTIARYFTPLKATYHSLQRRMKMKSKLLSRKLWMTILGSVILVLNQQLGWELNAESIIGIGSLFMSFILGQSVVDTNGVGQFAPLLQKLKSSKLWVSLIGSALIIINDEYKLGFTADNIYIAVGIAVSFIFGKSAVSVVQASNGSNKDSANHYR